MTMEEEVRNASKHFYTALNSMVNGNPGPLMEIWAHDSSVSTMHPVGGRQVGWDDVRKTWEQVAQVSSDGKVELQDQVIHVAGDVAYEIGIEQARFKVGGTPAAGKVRVTNIYHREAGGWKIIHHHTDPAPEMIEALKRLH